MDARVEMHDVSVTTDGSALHIRCWEPEARTEPPFVLLHGIASNARIWDGAARLLAEAGHAAYALDLRGHGESDDGDRPFDIAEFADDVSAVVDALRLDRPVVAGHSLGGDVAVELAVRRPELAGAIVLVEGGIAGGDSQFETWEECEAKMKLPPVAGLPRAAVEGFLRKSNPGWPEWRLQASMASFVVAADGSVDWRLSADGYRSLLGSLWNQPLAELWPSIRVPVLGILVDTGDERWTQGKRRAADAACAAVPGVRIAWMSGEHEVHAQAPDRVAEILLSGGRAAVGE